MWRVRRAGCSARTASWRSIRRCATSRDRKSTRLNSSHGYISYAVFSLKKKRYNVYSIEVESALYEHPDIVEAPVVGVPHDVLGQDVCAVVRVRGGATPLEPRSVRACLA